VHDIRIDNLFVEVWKKIEIGEVTYSVNGPP
jgi:hypothetical protein